MNQISFDHLANFNSAVPWGLWVSIYIWLVGISAGSFLLVTWANLKNSLHLKKITQLGLALSLSCLLAGLLSILIDLGHIERFYKLFISPNPTSAMAWMVWLYGVYAIVLVAYFFRLKKSVPRRFLQFSLIFGLGILLLESLLFALPPGKHWHSLIFPLHFLICSLVSAITALILSVGILWAKEAKTELLKGLSKIAIPLIFINLGIEIVEMVSLAHISHIESWLLVLGNLVAIALLLRHNPITITIAAGIELIDTLLSKYNSLISAQVVEPFKGFGQAYMEPKLSFSYIPSSFEFLVSLFLISLAAGLFYFLYKIFTLSREV